MYLLSYLQVVPTSTTCLQATDLKLANSIINNNNNNNNNHNSSRKGKFLSSASQTTFIDRDVPFPCITMCFMDLNVFPFLLNSNIPIEYIYGGPFPCTILPLAE
jgi:hypothetical protein